MILRKGQNWGFPTYNWQKMEEDGMPGGSSASTR